MEDSKPRLRITIFSGTGCFSKVGKQPAAKNQVSIKIPGCMRKHVVIHEFLHALGFWHMQSSFDRDQYVKIRWENINEKNKHNFNKYSNVFISHFGTKYDIDSIMHYGSKYFSKNGEITIQTLDPANQSRVGQRARLSPGDTERINKMYKCEG